MTGSHRRRGLDFVALVLATLAVSAIAQQALAIFPCDWGGSTNSCRYGASNPCYAYQSTNCGDFNFNGMTSQICSAAYDPTLKSWGYYFTPSTFVNGDWYRCTTVSGSGTGACTENIKPCMTVVLYRAYQVNGPPGTARTCIVPCSTDTEYACQAGSGAPICGTYGQP